MRPIQILLSCSLLLACSSHKGGAGDAPDAQPSAPMPDAWQIQIDFTDLDRFLDVAARPDRTWHVAGTAVASKGLASLAIAGAPVTVGEGGAFAADVPVDLGLTRVPIVGTDVAGDARKAH